MVDFTKLRIAVLATHGFEELELTEPLRAVMQTGAHVDVIAPPSAREEAQQLGIDSQRIQGFHHFNKGISVPVDLYLDQEMASPDNYHGLILPGGALNADKMRVEPLVIKFVQDIQAAEKPMGIICHAPWILISAGLVRGRKLTSYHTIKDDVKNAGGNWVDQGAVFDANWVTSRQPSDLVAFNGGIIELLSRPAPLMSDDVRRSAAQARIA
jgi:protease I